MNANEYIAAIAGADDAQEACDRLTAAGHQAAVEDDAVVIGDGAAKAVPFEGVNQIGDHFFLWLVHDASDELVLCVPRGKQGSCPPRH